MKNINLYPLVIVVLIVPLLFTGCSKSPDENLPDEPVPIKLTEIQTSIVGSGNTFAFDIFRKTVGSSDPAENIIISPLSISCALSMTLNGANGTTRDAMLEALRVNGISPEDINLAFEKLTEALLNVDKRVIMTIANSVWTEKNFDVKQAFIDVLTEYYDAESKDFDITDPNVPAKVNTWIESKTNGLIREMISNLPDNTVMLLINAIYFKGKWSSEFDADKTQNKPFYLSSGASVSVPTMIQKNDFRIYDGDGFAMGEFPYGQGNFVMDIILPDEKNGLVSLLPTITDEVFAGWVDQLVEREVNLFLPRFKYDFKKSLVDILTDMGMGIAFTDDADFTNIAAFPPLLISDVLHQAFIETNEEGTEAAAATVVVIGITSAGPHDPFTFAADHPFIYVIREVTTGSIIFMGRVSDPMAELRETNG